MADFKISVSLTLKNEGGYVNDPADPGGETYKGISRINHPTWPGWMIINNYKNGPWTFPYVLESDQKLQSLVVEEYTSGYWKPLYSQIEDQSVADKLFDMGVLFGVGTAVKNLQQALTSGFSIAVDGGFGAETLSAINQADGPSLLNAYKTLLVSHAFAIATAKPETRKFVAGWGRRINS